MKSLRVAANYPEAFFSSYRLLFITDITRPAIEIRIANRSTKELLQKARSMMDDENATEAEIKAICMELVNAALEGDVDAAIFIRDITEEDA